MSAVTAVWVVCIVCYVLIHHLCQLCKYIFHSRRCLSVCQSVCHLAEESDVILEVVITLYCEAVVFVKAELLHCLILCVYHLLYLCYCQYLCHNRLFVFMRYL